MSRRRAIEGAMEFAEILKEKGRFVLIHGANDPSELADDIITKMNDETFMQKFEQEKFDIEDAALFYTMGIMMGVNLKR